MGLKAAELCLVEKAKEGKGARYRSGKPPKKDDLTRSRSLPHRTSNIRSPLYDNEVGLRLGNDCPQLFQLLAVTKGNWGSGGTRITT